MYNVIGSVAPLAVSMLTVPIYLTEIGLDRYGILSICWILLGYFNLFDFGLGRAIAQRVGSLAASDPDERSRVFWSGMVLSAALIALGVAVFVPVAKFGFAAIQLGDPRLRSELVASLPLLVATLPVGILSSLMRGALEGRSEFLALNLLAIVSSVSTTLLPLVAVWLYGPSLEYLVTASLLGRLLTIAGMARQCIVAVPLYRPQLVAREELFSLLKFGGWTTVSSIVAPLLVYADRFVIGSTLGARAVAIYTVPYTLISQVSVIPAAVATATFPRFAASKGQSAANLSTTTQITLLCILAPATIIAAGLVEPVLKLWIGPVIGPASSPAALALLFGFWSNSLARVPFARLQAQGRPKAIAITHLSEVIPYLVLLYFTLIPWGILGAAVVWSLRTSIDAAVLLRLVGEDRLVVRMSAITAVPVVTAIIAQFIIPDLLLRVFVAAMIAIVTAAVLIKFTGLPSRLSRQTIFGMWT